MTNTTNYNLLLAEGTDLVNYLTQTNPNFSALDTIIKDVSDDTVTPATEVTTGTAHAISRTLPDATVIKFTATSNWQTGDTMTLDGTPVTPLKTDGTTLKTGDYIIGSAVLMIQDATRVTVLVASSPDAGDINYDNSVSGLTANKVQGAIDENATAIRNLTDIVDNAVSSSQYNGRMIYNNHIKIAQLILNVENLVSGSTAWQTVTTNDTVFKAPLRNVYGKSQFGDFRILNSPFSIDVNLRGAATTSDTLSCMYFMR